MDSVAVAAGVAAEAPVLLVRAMAPSCTPAPAEGAETGALASCGWLGAKTGGSSSMVYSRTSLPRDQFTSTSIVRKGSEIGSFDFSLMT